MADSDITVSHLNAIPAQGFVALIWQVTDPNEGGFPIYSFPPLRSSLRAVTRAAPRSRSPRAKPMPCTLGSCPASPITTGCGLETNLACSVNGTQNHRSTVLSLMCDDGRAIRHGVAPSWIPATLRREGHAESGGVKGPPTEAALL
jgi:hypothetical protein